LRGADENAVAAILSMHRPSADRPRAIETSDHRGAERVHVRDATRHVREHRRVVPAMRCTNDGHTTVGIQHIRFDKLMEPEMTIFKALQSAVLGIDDDDDVNAAEEVEEKP
jgi:hypothetical protein